MAHADHLLQRRVALLGTLDLFRPLAAPQLARLGTEIVAISFPAGAVIAREGEDDDHFFVVVDGEVELTCCTRLVDVRSRRRARRVLSPDLVDQRLGRNDLVPMEQEEREQRALPTAGKRQQAAVARDLQRPQDGVTRLFAPAKRRTRTC